VPSLTCSLEPTSAGPGRHGLRFGIRNHGSTPVTLTWWEPFLGFDLTASAADGTVPIVRPIFDTGAQPVSTQLAPDEDRWLETPIQLAFDPDVPPSGGPDPTVWTLVHQPVPVELSVVVHLPSGELRSVARLDPTSAGFGQDNV